MLKIQQMNHDDYVRVQYESNRGRHSVTDCRDSIVESIKDYHGEASRILCHGTRTNLEQKKFANTFTDSYVVGSELTDFAQMYDMTVQHDFHEPKEEWVNSFDVIYTNSFGKSLDPVKALTTWKNQLNENGTLYVQLNFRYLDAHRDIVRAYNPMNFNCLGFVECVRAAGLDVVANWGDADTIYALKPAKPHVTGEKNLVLQHWDSTDLPEWARAATASMKWYAEEICGAEYKLLHGMPFQEGAHVNAQKISILNEEFDEYDNVLMCDTDQLAVPWAKDNIFAFNGIGQAGLWRGKIMDEMLIGGSHYKFTREQRQTLRSYLGDRKQYTDPTWQWAGSDEYILSKVLRESKMPLTSTPGWFDVTPGKPNPRTENYAGDIRKQQVLHYMGPRKKRMISDIEQFYGRDWRSILNV